MEEMLQKAEEIRKTGTTTVGIICKNAVVLGADRKSSMGYLVANPDVKKVLEIDEHLCMTIAGLVGDAQALDRYIKAELKLYKLQEGRRISVKSAARLMGNILYHRRFYPYIVQLLIGGYDTAPRLYSFDPSGSIQEELKFFSTGSGSPIALGVLEDGFREGMEAEEGKRLVIRSLKSATKRDIASGGSGFDIAIIDSRGIRWATEEEIRKAVGKDN